MKIKLTEDQYKRIFLNEQTPSDPSAFDSEAYKRGKDREFERQTAELASLSKYSNDKFKLAQSQWAKFGAENPKTGRNLIPQSTIDELGKQYTEAVKQYNLTQYDVEDPNDKDYQMKKWQDDVLMYGDTETGALSQSLKSSNLVFGPKGYEPFYAQAMRDEQRNQIDVDIPYIAAVGYNNNINQQKDLIPQYCKKPNLTKWYYEFICGSGECDEVSDETWKRLDKRRAEKSGKYGWYGKNIKAGIGEYGYYLAFRDDVGQDPFSLCANATSKGVWVYNTKYGYHCGCYMATNTKHATDLGTYGEDYLLGFHQTFKKYKKEHAPGFLESVVNYFGGCFDDYHCILDLMSIAALAIPGIGVFVSTGLDVVNAAAYGVEAYTADNTADRDASLVAGSLTLFGGLAGSFGKTNKLLKYGNANPKIYNYADDVYAKINKEFPDLVNVGKITNNADKIKLNSIYKELAEKYSLKDSEILVAHDMLNLLKSVPKEQAKLYTEALTKIESKLGKTELIDLFKTKKWKNALKKNNGDIVATLDRFLRRPDTKALFYNVGAFVGVQEILEIPEVAKYVQKFVGSAKYMIKQTPRHLVESYGYPWEPTKMAFGAISTKDAEGKPNKEFTNAKSAKDNNLLKSAWIAGWRPYSEEVENPTEKDFEYGWNWLMKPENEKYRTETFKKRLKSIELYKGIDTNKDKSEEEIEIQKQEKIENTSISSEERVEIDKKNDQQLIDLFGEDIFNR